MLLSAPRGRRRSSILRPLRGVFARDDAWIVTGDLFRRDADGDYWLLDHIPAMIRTESGPVAAGPLRDALGTCRRSTWS